ncbi:MAG: diguanylate cyclase [Rubrivivax sp.]
MTRAADPVSPDRCASERADAAWYGLDFDPDASAAAAQQLLAEARAAADRCLEAAALCVLAWHRGARGESLEQALQQAHEARQAVDECGADALRVRVHAATAMVLGALGDRAGRFEELEAMRRSAVAAGDPYHEVLALHDLGLGFDRPELLEQALERARVLPQPGVLVVANLLHSVPPRQRSGDGAGALARAEQAWALARELGSARWQVEALRILAVVQAQAGRRRDAMASLALLQQHPAARGELVALCAGRVHAALHQTARAIAAYEACLQASDRPRLQLDAARELAPLLARAGRWRRAYDCQQQAEALRHRLQQEEGERRLRGLEVQHRLALREQQIEQERERLREQAAYVERLERLNREITELSVRDPLTGQYNRRHADAELARALSRVARGDDTLVLALLDIDHFKQVNDRHGHAAGDAVLRRVAACVAAGLRGADLLARFGGEEFVLLFPGARLDAAALACERIRVAVEALALDDVAAGLRVTVSIGVAAAHAGQDADALLHAADERLYAAKHAGRNRVLRAGGRGDGAP